MPLIFSSSCDIDCVLASAAIAFVGGLGLCCLSTFFVKSILELRRPQQGQEEATYTGLEV
jgi:hypothetical protein